MVVTVTEGRYSPERQAQTEAFLAEFLPRMKEEPGVVEILHYADSEGGTTSTLVVWESEADVGRYREGELIKEAIAFEQRGGEPARRSGPFPVQVRLTGGKDEERRSAARAAAA
jgi:quinol monooxygenase YgiN